MCLHSGVFMKTKWDNLSTVQWIFVSDFSTFCNRASLQWATDNKCHLASPTASVWMSTDISLDHCFNWLMLSCHLFFMSFITVPNPRPLGYCLLSFHPGCFLLWTSVEQLWTDVPLLPIPKDATSLDYPLETAHFLTLWVPQGLWGENVLTSFYFSNPFLFTK